MLGVVPGIILAHQLLLVANNEKNTTHKLDKQCTTRRGSMFLTCASLPSDEAGKREGRDPPSWRASLLGAKDMV